MIFIVPPFVFLEHAPALLNAPNCCVCTIYLFVVWLCYAYLLVVKCYVCNIIPT